MATPFPFASPFRTLQPHDRWAQIFIWQDSRVIVSIHRRVLNDTPKVSSRIHTVDALRGIASFAVCWFHFTHGNKTFLTPGLLNDTGNYGWAGVEIFFVISGFIIPYSMFKSGYTLNGFWTFCRKRIIRLDPPYIAAIGIILILEVLCRKIPGFRGEPFYFSWKQAAAHLAYLNVVFGYEWYSPAFWTLAIEFQFYLLMGLLFPFISSPRRGERYAILILLSILPFAGFGGQWIFTHLFFFVFGMVAFHFKSQLMQRNELLLVLLILFPVVCYKSGVFLGFLGMGTALCICYLEIKSKILIWMGAVSYSLYLLHVPIGGRVINLSLRWKLSDPEKLIVIVLALAISYLAAYILYRLVERPSQKWSSSIR